MDNIGFSTLVPVFKDALCSGEIGFTADGYLSQCFTNTYLFAPLAIVLSIWAIADTKDIRNDGHPADSLAGRLNFLFTAMYTVVVFQYGPGIFNVIALVASMLSLAVMFILSFLDMKGVNVARKPIEIYFFLIAAVSGYYVVQFIGIKKHGAPLRSAVFICLVTSIAGSVRNLCSAFDEAQSEAKKPSTKKA